jgi:hypothetical protein
MKKSLPTLRLSQLTVALTLALGLLPNAHAQAITQEAMLQRFEALQAELNRLKAELSELKAAQGQTQLKADEAKQQADAAKTEAASATSKANTAVASVEQASGQTGGQANGQAGGQGSNKGISATTLTGYGEMAYNRYSKNSAANQFNVRRVVLGVNHRFSEKTKLVTEIEFENAVTSSTDRGEVAIEQAYLEHQLNNTLALRAGLFIIPMGFLNERHEPFAYYGVDRNFVETAIIPSTWREGGLMLSNNFDNGVSLKGGLSTGWDIGKWDATSAESKQSPLRTLHQEGQFAKSKDLNLFGALEYRGVPGLLVGGSFFTGKSGHKGLTAANGTTLNVNPNITLWDLKARYQVGRWDLQALFAKGTISQTAQLNAPLAASLAPIPSAFQGGYAQVAYRAWSRGDQKLMPFARIERFNTGMGFNLPAGLGRPDDPTEQVLTLGASFFVTPTVVVKADYQSFKVNTLMNRFNLGLGWSF